MLWVLYVLSPCEYTHANYFSFSHQLSLASGPIAAPPVGMACALVYTI